MKMSGQNCETKPSQQIDRDIRSEATEGSDKKMKITDLTIICLEEIFEYLDTKNLLNVADSNKRLNIAACFVFRRRIGKKVVILDNFDNNPRDSAMNVVLNIRIYVSKATDRFRFLRCFGCVTSNLTVFSYDCSQKQIDKICFYINEYCAESLIELYIVGLGNDAIIFTHLQRPFMNIETLIFRHCNLGTNLLQFNKWFPKMRHLELVKNQMIEKECIEINFPNLRYLEYRSINDNENVTPHFENIIRLNPDIRSLDLYCWNEKLLQHISNYLPQLEELEIRNRLIEAAEPDFDSGQIHFKSLKKLRIDFYTDISERFVKINFIFDQLEELHVSGFNDLMTFVKKYSTITKLKLGYNNDMNMENALPIAKALPLLFELQLTQKLSIDKIIRFVNEFKQVKKIYFQLDKQSKGDDLRAKLGSEWEVYIDPERRYLKEYIISQRVIK